MYCKVVFLFCLFIMQPWFYSVVKYCFNAICFTRFIFVNSVMVSSIISCNDLYQDFIIMYIWYFVSRNSISVLGAIWPSLSPCTVINPILLTYLQITKVFQSITQSVKGWLKKISKLDYDQNIYLSKINCGKKSGKHQYKKYQTL